MPNLKKSSKLVNNLRNIHAINRIPMKEFRECMQIVKDFIYIDTPDEYVFESLKERLSHRQIERLIEYYKWFNGYQALKGAQRKINATFPKKVVDKAKKIIAEEKKDALLQQQINIYAKSGMRRKAQIKKVIARKEAIEFEKWMEQHRPTTKDRKPKPKKTFWHVPNPKYRSKTKK